LPGGCVGTTASGEAVYKIYAESFKDEQHLQAILDEAQQIVSNA
jgi:phosphoglucomutase